MPKSILDALNSSVNLTNDQYTLRRFNMMLSDIRTFKTLLHVTEVCFQQMSQPVVS